MHPDDDPNLRAGFAELHRRQREQAPPFSAMRERALRQPTERVNSSQKTWFAHRLGWTAAASAAALMTWAGLELFRRESPRTNHPSSTEQVNDLLAAIEHHVEANEPQLEVEYPTDLLLVENQTGLAP